MHQKTCLTAVTNSDRVSTCFCGGLQVNVDVMLPCADTHLHAPKKTEQNQKTAVRMWALRQKKQQKKTHLRNAGNEQNLQWGRKVSFEQPVSVFPLCLLRLTRTEPLFIEHGEQGIRAIPVVFLDASLMTQGVEVCACAQTVCLCAQIKTLPAPHTALLSAGMQRLCFPTCVVVLCVCICGVRVHFCS